MNHPKTSVLTAAMPAGLMAASTAEKDDNGRDGWQTGRQTYFQKPTIRVREVEMKKSFVLALSILVFLAVVGFSKPGYAADFSECLETWEGYLIKKCIKIKGPDALECLDKADQRFTKCLKKAEDLDKKKRKQMIKCMNKRELDREEFSELSKGKRKKALGKFLKWTDTCKDKYIE